MPMRALVFLLLAIAEYFPHFIAAMSPCRRRRRAAPPLWNDLPPFPGSYRQLPRIAPPGFYLDPPPEWLPANAPRRSDRRQKHPEMLGRDRNAALTGLP